MEPPEYIMLSVEPLATRKLYDAYIYTYIDRLYGLHDVTLTSFHDVKSKSQLRLYVTPRYRDAKKSSHTPEAPPQPWPRAFCRPRPQRQGFLPARVAQLLPASSMKSVTFEPPRTRRPAGQPLDRARLPWDRIHVKNATAEPDGGNVV